MPKVLIIDDDQQLCAMISKLCGSRGHETRAAHTLKDGMAALAAETCDVVFLDVGLPDGDGLTALPEIKASATQPEVIIITGASSPDGAELAIRSGAWDYVAKSASINEMLLAVERALEYRRQKMEAGKPVALQRHHILGSSNRIRACLDQVAAAASTDANVLVCGETGTGKELLARAIHDNSPRRNRNFVVVDCAALPDTLVESVLFGHVKGAFTGADRSESGLMKQADGGTLFLDEVGELPLQMQTAFLRSLQERRFRPVGGRNEVESDFRLVAATNRGLEDMVTEGTFREDLLFRIRSVVIELPPIRERREDLNELACHYIARICEKNGLGVKGFVPEVLASLTAYDWPGNVRELIHVLETAVVAARKEPTLFPQHLPTYMRVQLKRASLEGTSADAVPSSPSDEVPAVLPQLRIARESAIAKAEKDYLRQLMDSTAGDIQAACETSGLSQSRLYALLKKYGLSARS